MIKLLLFKLSTCCPCRLVSKLLTDLKYNHEDIVIDEYENADELVDKYNVKSVPTVVVLDKYGVELGRFIGPKTKEQLLEEISKYSKDDGD